MQTRIFKFKAYIQRCRFFSKSEGLTALSRTSVTHDYASLKEEERHVLGIRVNEVILVDLGEQGGDDRGALGLGELATPELARFRGLGDLCAHTLTIRARKWMDYYG